MSSPSVERTAAAMLYWARRRDDEAIRGTLAGLSDAERRAACDRLLRRDMDALTGDQLVERLFELAGKGRGHAHKVVDPQTKSAPTPVAVLDRAPATTDSGSFVGYLAAWQRDLGGDTIEPAAIDATLSDFRAGRIRWLLTDAHSPKASDVVAVVDAAAPDGADRPKRSGTRPSPSSMEAGQRLLERAVGVDGCASVGVTVGAASNSLGRFCQGIGREARPGEELLSPFGAWSAP